MYVKTRDNKCCLFMQQKTVIYVIGVFLMFSQIFGVVLMVFLFNTNKEITRAMDLDNKEFWDNVIIIALCMGLILTWAISIICFTVVLLIGIRRNDRHLIRAYMIFSFVFLLLSLVLCFVSEYVFFFNATASIHRMLTLAHAFFLCVIRNYWLRLEPINLILYHDA